MTPPPTSPTAFILATAGHVDHGKSALVRALTGTDPDRLPEEKARGITIDLGFALLDLAPPPGAVPVVSPTARYHVGVVDVPGHEDFVRNMVAGIGSIDLALLIVAADDGWMPQTEEHLQILTYLGVARGVVALTKIDLAASEAGAVAAVRERLRGSPLAESAIVPTAVAPGRPPRGLDELKAALSAVLADTPPQRDVGKPRLPVDRAFALKGVGTVVTGTLSGGTFSRGQGAVVQPAGRPTRVRNLQSHNRDVESAAPGSRVALNLPDLAAGAGHAARAAATDAAVRRGDVVTLPTLGGPCDTWDVLLERAARSFDNATPPRALKDGTAVHVHHGSGDFAARLHLLDAKDLAPGDKAPAQVRFESPVFAFAGDRFVVRDWSARHTLAGGLVLDPDARRQDFRADARRAFLQARAAEPHSAAAFIASQVTRDGVARAGGAAAGVLLKSRFSADEVAAAAAALAAAGKVVVAGSLLVDPARWQWLRRRAAAAVDAWHKEHPEQTGLKLTDLRRAIEADLPRPAPGGTAPPEAAGEADASALFDALVTDLCKSEFARAGAALRRASHRPALPPHLLAAGARLRTALAAKPFEPPARKELAREPASHAALKFLLTSGEVVDLGPDLVMLADHAARAAGVVRELITRQGSATVSDMRQALGTNRRVIVPLAEYLDRTGVTLRKGDVRVLR